MKVLKTLLLAVTAISFSAGSPLAAQDREVARRNCKHAARCGAYSRLHIKSC